MVGFESNIRKNTHREPRKNHDLSRQQERLATEVKYVNLSVRTLGVVDQLSLSFLGMLRDQIMFPAPEATYFQKSPLSPFQLRIISIVVELKIGTILDC